MENLDSNNGTVVNPDTDVKETTKVGKKRRDIGIHVPEHIVEIAYIVKDNAAIRRFTSLNILNHLIQIGRLSSDSGGMYVNFLWNKFQVTADGLKNQYSYKEKFFLESLSKAVGQFEQSIQDTIKNFIAKENLDFKAK